MLPFGYNYLLFIREPCDMMEYEPCVGAKLVIACVGSPFTRDCFSYRMHGHTYSKSMDQPGKVANPACGQLNRENEYFPVYVRA